jgi:hypothetical protein
VSGVLLLIAAALHDTERVEAGLAAASSLLAAMSARSKHGLPAGLFALSGTFFSYLVVSALFSRSALGVVTWLSLASFLVNFFASISLLSTWQTRQDLDEEFHV